MDDYEGETDTPRSLHKYLFCQANPINSIDPSGHDIGEVLASFEIFSFWVALSQVESIASTLRIDPSASPAFQKRVQGGIDQLRKAAPRGPELLQAAQHNIRIIIIRPGDPDQPRTWPKEGFDWSQNADLILLDPETANGISPYDPSLGENKGLPKPSKDEDVPKDATGLAVALAHELGHILYAPALDGEDPIIPGNPPSKRVMGGLNVAKNENPVRQALHIQLRRHYHGFKIPNNLVLVP